MNIMSRRTNVYRALFWLTFVVSLPVFWVSCSGTNEVASSNAHLILTADPPQIGLRGTSLLTVTGVDANGAPLPDGTSVTFSVDKAGRVSPSSVKLMGGTATSTYFATASAGDISVTATSGSVQASTTITIADEIQKKNVFVSANPATFTTGGGTSVINAVVTDDSGKPIANVGVTFSTTAGTLQSRGAIIDTNANGIATDTFNTSESATITATTDDGFSGQVTVQVGIGRVVCHMSASTSTPTVGQTVSFFDTSDDPASQIATYQWNFGDGGLAQGQNPQHAYSSAGTFSVIH
ncbi:MAG TPA: PKD domain-containing protein, partial [Acidobacteriota bacterium]|nr:PKD domain-containing protein [Acidobacteriota bacterium]